MNADTPVDAATGWAQVIGAALAGLFVHYVLGRRLLPSDEPEAAGRFPGASSSAEASAGASSPDE